MQIVKKINSRKLEPNFSTKIWEYLIEEKSLSGAIAEINGRYPSAGFVINNKSKEMAYVLSGQGKLVGEKQTIEFVEGDVIFIQAKEKYYWQGKFKLFMVNSPAFEDKQHQSVK